jgi:ABC-type transport system involved in cytochrome bd biosynthesis fused ATPase/permease subunit
MFPCRFGLGTLEAQAVSRIGFETGPWSHSTPTTDSVKCGNLLGRLQISEQEAAIIAVMHDEKIHDRLDRIYKLRDGRLIETEERAAA